MASFAENLTEKQFQADESSLPSNQPRPADKKRSTGFDCEFVDRPPKAFQTDCPICLLVLREPYQASCCGYTYCRGCIEQLKLDNKACPTCNQVDFSLFQDKRLQRSLLELSVRCPHVKEGCEWKGELRGLEKHLNEDPISGGDSLVACEFAAVECIHCAEAFQRRYITTHQIEDCLRRPFSCDYCGNYGSDFEDVTQKHWAICGCYPISCPNHCSPYAVERQKMDHHLKKECPLVVVSCDIHGCEVRLPRKDIPNHLAESLPLHLSLLAKHSQKTEEEKEKMSELEKGVEENKRKIEELITENQALRRLLSEKNKEITQLKGEQEDTRLLVSTLQSYAGVIPVQLSMTHFQEHKDAGSIWYSEPFYTHPRGYKMCLSVKPNAGSCISVWFHILRGDFDNILSWPFQGQLTLQLMNQLEDTNHHTDSVCLTNCNVSSCINRLTTGERATAWGFPGFLPLSDLGYDMAKNRQFLKDDCLRFQVTQVTNVSLASMLAKQYLPALSRVCVTPLDFILDCFEERKVHGLCWLSPSFYTQPRGYRMCLHVDPFGWNDCRGTHIAVFVCLMRGEFDNYLQWPFRGSVTVQLLNQLEDRNHADFTIHFTQMTLNSAAGRVTTGERGETWNLFQNKFLSYDALSYNCAKKTLYLDKDCLHFRVTKVEVKK